MRPEVNVLLVCAGNTCRSPMGEGLLASALAGGAAAHGVRSAGMSAVADPTVSGRAVRVMQELGVDITGHAPRAMTADLVAWADVIVPVERRLGAQLLARFPEAGPRLRYLPRDVADPLAEGTLPAYRRARDELRDGLGALMKEWSGE